MRVKALKLTKEILKPLIEESKNYSDLMRKLEIKNNGGNFRTLQKRIRYLNIDVSHFTGHAWNKGQSAKTNSIVKEITKKRSYPLEEVLCENSPITSNSSLRRIILRHQLIEYKCSIPYCGITKWHGNILTLHLDHVNGVSNDNRLENLRFLCPNCHQQTDTWGNKKPKQEAVAQRQEASGLEPEQCEFESHPSQRTCECGNILQFRKRKCDDCKSNKCILCAKTISSKAKKCKSCEAQSRSQPTKIAWPSTEELLEELRSKSYTKLASELGVTDNSIRKRIKNHPVN